MKKRILLTVCILSLAMGCLSGCGKKNEESAESGSTQSPTVPTVQSDYREDSTASPSETVSTEDSAAPSDSETPSTETVAAATDSGEDDGESSVSPSASPSAESTESTENTEGSTSTESSSTGALSDGKLVVGVNAALPPYEYYDKDGLSGIDIAVMDAIGTSLNVEIVYRNMEFSALLPAVESGEIEAAISTITATENRASYASLTDSYLTESITALVKSNSTLNSAEAIDGSDATVAVVSGSLADYYYSAEHPDAEILRVATAKKAFQAVKKGKADCALLEASQAQTLAEGKSKFVTFDYLVENYVIAVSPTDAELLSQMNSAISALKSSGAISLIYSEQVGQ